ncbi:MAG: peptidylprolyl isomerase [Actinomycetota bacterium]
MSPKDRDRAREKRRYEKRQARLATRAAEARHNKQVLGVVLAIVVVIGGFVALSKTLSSDTATTTATPLASQSAAVPSAQPSAPAKNVVAGCVTPPPVPTDGRKRDLPDKKIAAGKTFIATVTTNCGVITMELDGTLAPQTVASFLGLAESGYWVDSPCHRLTVAKDGIFVLQCGDPTGTGGGNPGYGFGVENAPRDSIFPPGTLAMARTSDPKSNGGQFFIVYQKTVLQDPVGYSIFGKVTSGMDIVDKIAKAGLAPAGGSTAPLQPISILKVAVAQKKA